MSDLASLRPLLPLLAAAFVSGAGMQLLRLLTWRAPPRLRVLLARLAAAGMAALLVAGLLKALQPGTAPALLLAAACLSGWSGPGLLTRLEALLAERLGLPREVRRRRGGWKESRSTHPEDRDGQTEA